MGNAVRGLHSLRWRLTLPYVALLALLLVVLGATQYASLRQSLIDARVASLSGDVDTARAVFARPANRNIGFATGATKFAIALSALSGRGVGVAVYDSTHNVQALEPTDATLPRLDEATLNDAAGRSAAGTDHTVARIVDTPAGSMLTVAYPVTLANNGAGVIELAAPMDPIDSVLRHDIVLRIVGGGVALGIALFLGLALTASGLRPLQRLTVTAGELAAGNLSARSRVEHRNDEVGVLGRAFDHMADRIEQAFTAQAASEAQMRRFIADASHELRTPVTALKGYVDVMRRGAGRDPDSLDAILESMQREAERMRVLVLDLLTLARLDARKDLAAESVDVNVLVAQVLDEGVPGLPHDLTRAFASGPVTARADPNALTTVLRNLLVNACKYAPGAAQTWSTGRNTTQVLIAVHDAGPGIPAADLPHIFERFYRGEKMRAREEGGSGLGLSIVQGLVRGMGGDVAVASAEGRGTTVTIALPAAAP